MHMGKISPMKNNEELVTANVINFNGSSMFSQKFASFKELKEAVS